MSMFRKLTGSSHRHADASEVDLVLSLDDFVFCLGLALGFAKLCSLQELIKFLNCQHYSQDINKFTYLLLLVCSIDLEVAGSVFERVFVL